MSKDDSAPADDLRFEAAEIYRRVHGKPPTADFDVIDWYDDYQSQAAAVEVKADIPRSECALKRALRLLGVEYRWNSRTYRKEMRAEAGNFAGISDLWHVPEQHREARLIGEIADRFERHVPGARRGTPPEPARFKREEYDQFTTAIAAQNECDPWLNWLKSLPYWDGRERIASIFSQCFQMDTSVPGNDRFADLAASIVTLGAVQQAHEPGSDIHMMPVIFGPGDTGKSTFCKWLVPEPFRDQYFTRSFDITHKEPKHEIEQLSGKIIAEIQELAGMRKADVETVKANLTREISEARVAYGRHPITRKRSAVLIATANPSDFGTFPDDPAIWSRIVPVVIKGAETFAKSLFSEDFLEQLWAEALSMYNLGDRVQGRASKLGPEHTAWMRRHVLTDPGIASAVREHWGADDRHADGWALADLISNIALKLPSQHLERRILLAEIKRWYTQRRNEKARRWFPNAAPDD